MSASNFDTSIIIITTTICVIVPVQLKRASWFHQLCKSGQIFQISWMVDRLKNKIHAPITIFRYNLQNEYHHESCLILKEGENKPRSIQQLNLLSLIFLKINRFRKWEKKLLVDSGYILSRLLLNDLPGLVVQKLKLFPYLISLFPELQPLHLQLNSIIFVWACFKRKWCWKEFSRGQLYHFGELPPNPTVWTIQMSKIIGYWIGTSR